MTERGDESRTLQALLELLPVGVVIGHDSRCGHLTANAAAMRMLGRPVVAGELPAMTDAVAAGRAVRDVKAELARADGSLLRCSVSAGPIVGADGTAVGCVAVFVDTAAESDPRAEQFRELALALADAEAHERKRLAQLLHDDFQQLISAAKLKAGIVRRLATDERVRGGAEQIEQLLETTINASRSLISELNPPVLYDGGLMPAIEALARSTHKQRGLRVFTQCDRRAEPKAEQVRVLLFEAVRELLHNVVRHARANAAGVTAGLHADGQVQIEVSDNGGGFDPSRLEPDPQRKSRPFGLLEIRERLRWLGGAMEVQSTIGRGTRVKLTVPAALRGADPTSAAASAPAATREQAPLPAKAPEGGKSASAGAAPAAAGPNGEHDHKPARILVADDHAMFREGLISLLKHEPEFEVVGEAADGQEAVDLARRLRPDILLVDVTMPKMNGLEVTSRLSRELPGVRIVGLSMHERQDMAAAMKSAGAVAYLTKGGSSETLLGLLRTLVPAHGGTADAGRGQSSVAT